MFKSISVYYLLSCSPYTSFLGLSSLVAVQDMEESALPRYNSYTLSNINWINRREKYGIHRRKSRRLRGASIDLTFSFFLKHIDAQGQPPDLSQGVVTPFSPIYEIILLFNFLRFPFITTVIQN